MRVLLLTSDLMFSSQTSQAAAAVGVDVQSCTSLAHLAQQLDADSCSAVVVDLNVSDLDLDQLNGMITDPATRRIAVGPHVHKAKLEAARQAGWQTLTRGQFHADAATFLRPPDI